MNIRNVVYWTTTILTAFVMLGGGIAYVCRIDAVVEGVTALGYPSYFILMLGICKLAAGLTVLLPRLPRLKEWAYAGITFNLLAAIVSHVETGAPVMKAIVPLLFMGIGLVSYAFRPASRRLGPGLFERGAVNAHHRQIAAASA